MLHRYADMAATVAANQSNISMHSYKCITLLALHEANSLQKNQLRAASLAGSPMSYEVRSSVIAFSQVESGRPLPITQQGLREYWSLMDGTG